MMMMLVLEEEEYNDDLDIGGGVGISTLDHSLEPGLTPPNVSTSVRSIRPNWTEKKLTNLGSVLYPLGNK